MSFNPKWLLGRTIVAVEMNTARVRPANGGEARTMHQPVIFLDNGASIGFTVEEHPDGAEYGIDIGYARHSRDPHPDAVRLEQKP